MVITVLNINKPRAKWVGSAFLFVLLLALLLMAGCSSGEPASETETEPERTPVEVEAASTRTIVENISFSGQLQPAEQAQVMAKLNAEVMAVPVSVGDRIEAGDVLVRLSADSIQNRVDQAEAAVSAARAGQKEAQQAFKSAQREYERMKPLYEQEAISEQQWDQTQDQYENARLAVEERAPAQLRQAQEQLASAREQLDNTVITAPISGEVTAVNTSSGNMAAPGAPLVVIIDRSQVEVSGVLSDRQVVQVEQGTEVTVRLSALGDRAINGTIKELAPGASAERGGFPVTVALSNEGGELRPGMFAEVSVPVRQAQDVVAVPNDAIVQRNDSRLVYVVEDGQALEQEVTPGLSDGSYTEVKEGLESGEPVVISGQEYLSDGSLVNVQNAGAAESEQMEEADGE